MTPSLERCRHKPSGAANIVDPRRHAVEKYPIWMLFDQRFLDQARRGGSAPSAKALAAQPRYSVVAAERVRSLKAMLIRSECCKKAIVRPEVSFACIFGDNSPNICA
jgi:hypothetical protein